MMLHDPGRALGAKHAAIDRVIWVAFDIAQIAIAEVYPDAAAAGAHVTSGIFDFVGYFWR